MPPVTDVGVNEGVKRVIKAPPELPLEASMSSATSIKKSPRSRKRRTTKQGDYITKMSSGDTLDQEPSKGRVRES